MVTDEGGQAGRIIVDRSMRSVHWVKGGKYRNNLVSVSPCSYLKPASPPLPPAGFQQLQGERHRRDYSCIHIILSTTLLPAAPLSVAMRSTIRSSTSSLLASPTSQHSCLPSCLFHRGIFLYGKWENAPSNHVFSQQGSLMERKA